MLKTCQNVHTDMEGFRRTSHTAILLLWYPRYHLHWLHIATFTRFTSAYVATTITM